MAVLLAFVAAIAVGAGPADAQQGAAVVAGPTPEGASLVAFDRGRRLCLQVRAPRSQEPAECLDRRVAVVVLPAAATPVRLLLRRGGSRPPLSRPFALPPAARQCGYTGATGSLERAGPAR